MGRKSTSNKGPDEHSSALTATYYAKSLIRRIPWLHVALVAAITGLVLQLAWPQILAWLHRPRPGMQVVQEMEIPHTCIEKYLVYLPSNYSRHRTWPTVVYLHGAGCRGSSPFRITAEGPPRHIKEGRKLPCIVISPLCRAEMSWNPNAVAALLDEVSQTLSIDLNRIYLTGFSMGAYGVWETACAYPNRFAAILPVSGGGNARDAHRLRDIPIWAFHGDNDELIPLSRMQEMVDAVRRAEAAVEFTIISEGGHAICNPTFGRQDVWDWLLKQRRVMAATRSSDRSTPVAASLVDGEVP